MLASTAPAYAACTWPVGRGAAQTSWCAARGSRRASRRAGPSRSASACGGVVERPERALQRRQAVERHAGEIVVLEVIVRVEEREIPEPVAAHQRAPLRGIGRIDVVVLAEPVQREGDREDEEDREQVGARRRAARRRTSRSARAPRGARRSTTLRSNAIALLQLGGIGRALPPRGAEVDREQRRRSVQQLVPARVDLRRQVMPLGIVFVRAELGVVIEMPARELARRDAARHRVQPARARARRAGGGVEDVWCTTSCSSTVKLKTVKPCTNASGIQMQRVGRIGSAPTSPAPGSRTGARRSADGAPPLLAWNARICVARQRAARARSAAPPRAGCNDEISQELNVIVLGLGLVASGLGDADRCEQQLPS